MTYDVPNLTADELRLLLTLLEAAAAKPDATDEDRRAVASIQQKIAEAN